jgi:hypothetical protein
MPFSPTMTALAGNDSISRCAKLRKFSTRTLLMRTLRSPY